MESGYFMALTDVGAGTKIEDTGGSTSQWIRLADEGGNGFAESYPLSPSYDHTNMKYNAKGERVVYLKGDAVKVQAHWASPGSHVFLKAQTDIPRGINLESLFAGGHIGPTGYFDFVGSDRSNGATADDKPLTEFLRTNANLAEPVVFNETAAGLRDLLLQNAPNGYQPSHVMLAAGTSIYAPLEIGGFSSYSSLWHPSRKVRLFLITGTQQTRGSSNLTQRSKETTMAEITLVALTYSMMVHGSRQRVMPLQRTSL